MKLQLHLDAPEEGDPQSPISSLAAEGFARIFEEELPLFYPDADNYDEVEISVSFLDCESMRQVNKDYRDTDEATDVLSFPLWEEDGRFLPKGALPELLPLGDILICPEEVSRMHGPLPFSEALCLVLAHGFLHLLAWDHDTPEKERTMWERQEQIKVKLLNVLDSLKEEVR